MPWVVLKFTGFITDFNLILLSVKPPRKPQQFHAKPPPAPPSSTTFSPSTESTSRVKKSSLRAQQKSGGKDNELKYRKSRRHRPATPPLSADTSFDDDREQGRGLRREQGQQSFGKSVLPVDPSRKQLLKMLKEKELERRKNKRLQNQKSTDGEYGLFIRPSQVADKPMKEPHIHYRQCQDQAGYCVT